LSLRRHARSVGHASPLTPLVGVRGGMTGSNAYSAALSPRIA
jgi:hypothetical protein